MALQKDESRIFPLQFYFMFQSKDKKYIGPYFMCSSAQNMGGNGKGEAEVCKRTPREWTKRKVGGGGVSRTSEDNNYSHLNNASHERQKRICCNASVHCSAAFFMQSAEYGFLCRARCNGVVAVAPMYSHFIRGFRCRRVVVVIK